MIANATMFLISNGKEFHVVCAYTKRLDSHIFFVFTFTFKNYTMNFTKMLMKQHQTNAWTDELWWRTSENLFTATAILARPPVCQVVVLLWCSYPKCPVLYGLGAYRLVEESFTWIIYADTHISLLFSRLMVERKSRCTTNKCMDLVKILQDEWV